MNSAQIINDKFIELDTKDVINMLLEGKKVYYSGYEIRPKFKFNSLDGVVTYINEVMKK